LDNPIELYSAVVLHKLEDAGLYIMALPKKVSALPHRQLAMATLMNAPRVGTS
jgi:hypothetical protein